MASPAAAAAETPPPPTPLASVPRPRRQRESLGTGSGGAPPPPPNGHGAGMPGSAGDLTTLLGQAEAAKQHVRWIIDEFKTAPCDVSVSPASAHDHRACAYFHNERDRRRPLVISDRGLPNYFGSPCPDRFDDLRRCARGDSCTMCHSTAELLYHVDFFRKRLCHQAQRCPRGKLCAFAHSRDDLLVPHFGEAVEASPSEEFIAFKFKTEWCPVGGLHDWESCVYAHTFRDWRRHPSLGYSSHPCPEWARSVASGAQEVGYAKRCHLGLGCPLAHGAKEQLYHPGFYKTHPCNDLFCRRGTLCAFTHGPHDTRSLPFEDAGPARVMRVAIPDAKVRLKALQPNFATPPMYHAFEDAPRVAGRSAGARVCRGAAGKGAEGKLRGRRIGLSGEGSFESAEPSASFALQPQHRRQQAWQQARGETQSDRWQPRREQRRRQQRRDCFEDQRWPQHRWQDEQQQQQQHEQQMSNKGMRQQYPKQEQQDQQEQQHQMQTQMQMQMQLQWQLSLFGSVQAGSPLTMTVAPEDACQREGCPMMFSDCTGSSHVPYMQQQELQAPNQGSLDFCLVLPAWLNSPVPECDPAAQVASNFCVASWYTESCEPECDENVHAAWGYPGMLEGTTAGAARAPSAVIDFSADKQCLGTGWRTPSVYGSRTPSVASSPRTGEAASSNAGGGSSEIASWEAEAPSAGGTA